MDCPPKKVAAVETWPLVEVRLQNPGEGPGGPGPPLFLDQNEARRTEKIFFKAGPGPLSEGLDDRPPPPPYLKVWICHWTVISLHLRRRERERERAHASQIVKHNFLC